ncbi:MAG: selenide, water dikinase SelD [Spirochaetes bacterium RBG_13_51_14]|nr:MAG: selenide, water dikinase SelD [Spirochaetes bacterium RBG_13_51_14]
MQSISVPSDGNVIVGMGASDDAGVYRISESSALVQTVDFITPIVDDPYLYGRIAACNSLSDVYAMGGIPLTALNIVCFPMGKFTLDVLSEVLKGGLAAMAEAGVQLLGGHSVDDPEMKYGLAVTGVVHPDRAVRNDAIRHGDAIVLTKPLGTGVIATALKAGTIDEAVMTPFVRSMSTLNRTASERMLRHGVHACTDVTGFGCIGHLREMLGGNSMEIIIDSKSVPLLPGARNAAAGGFVPGGMYKNRDFVGGLCSPDKAVSQDLLDILFDPQTSGGLLIALAEDAAGGLVSDLRASGITDAAIIGRVNNCKEQRITIK